MKAKLSVEQQGIKGGTPTCKDDVGYCACFFNDGKKHKIIVDAFSGAGDNYQRRAENEIEISNDNGVIFIGTIDQLITKLR